MLARLLVNRGAYVIFFNHRLWTPFHFACYHGEVELLRDMLEAPGVTVPFINLSASEFESTALHFTAYHYREARTSRGMACAALLLDHGADVNAQNARGQTPLFRANQYGYTELQLLLQARGGTL